jgi:hypothetical protein
LLEVRIFFAQLNYLTDKESKSALSRIFFCGLPLATLSHCKQSQETMFRLLSEDETGIDFKNTFAGN